ncbi:MAG: DUF4162 domain-containing protein, partial [Acidimicrobiia bacterium]|nr:DUF4162 domain-containing protein [Acidimicrobiia bacterium]
SRSLQAGADAALTLPGVEQAIVSDHSIDLIVHDAGAILPDLLAAVSGAGASIAGVEVVEPNLEAVFLQLTGKALRD